MSETSPQVHQLDNTARYALQLEQKQAHLAKLYAGMTPPGPEIYASAPDHFRMRAEFKVWLEGAGRYFAMFDPANPKKPIRIDQLDIASESINRVMPGLLTALNNSAMLANGIFMVKFLSTQAQEVLITLVYRCALSEAWPAAATELAKELGCHVVGRSKNAKTVLTRDYVTETFEVAGHHYRYRQYDNGFTQPNAGVNQHMLNWAIAAAGKNDKDLLELYCGNGNFTLPFAGCFRQVLATEVSKLSLRAAGENIQANGIENIALARLSAEEVSQALDGVRDFRRLSHISIEDYDFDTVFVDPPRAGLDDFTRAFIARFKRIIYISCNPDTQHRDVTALSDSHHITRWALFDQFPYTDHIECGLLLERN